MRATIRFRIDIEHRYETESYMERLKRLSHHLDVEHEILIEIVGESFVGQFLRDQNIRWTCTSQWGEIRLLDVSVEQLVAIRLSLSENETLIMCEEGAVELDPLVDAV